MQVGSLDSSGWESKRFLSGKVGVVLREDQQSSPTASLDVLQLDSPSALLPVSDLPPGLITLPVSRPKLLH